MSFVQQRLQRLEELQRQRPQFAELLAFYQALYGFFQNQKYSLLELTPDFESAPRRAERGFPLLDAGSLKFDQGRLEQFLSGLLAILGQYGQQGHEELERLQQGLKDRQFEPIPLLLATYERRREPLVKAAGALDVEPAIMAYILDMTLFFALRGAVESLQILPAENWQEGVCPTCGGLPAIGELSGDEGHLQLHCGSCGTGWSFPRRTCPFCGNQEKQEKEYFTASGERGYRVYLCRVCNCYLKTVDSRELGAGLPMDIEGVVTLYLDIIAQRKGFSPGKKPLV